MLLRFLHRKFGAEALSERVKRRLTRASSAQLDRWSDRMWSAKTLPAVFSRSARP